MPLSMLQQTPDVDSPLLSRHSGHPGTGTGGRANQLERIGALVGAPARTSQPKGSTSLNLNIPVNPLAPESVRKGCGSRAKKPPPPYSASELVDPPAATSTKAQGKKAKATKTAVIPPLSMEASDIQSSFHQHEAGASFSQHIVPPGTEPDLQALNNPYVATAREKVATMCLPAITTRSTKKDFVPPIPSRSTSAMMEVVKKIQNQTRLEVGWGASKGYLTAHPGFSKKVLPSQPQVTTALPSDFKFQYSHDEDNNIALAVEDSASSDDDIQLAAIEPKPDDVLLHHQKKNGCPLEESETKASMVKAPRSKELSEPKPTQLGWYLPHWKAFLEDAKGDCYTQHTIENAFPTLADDLPISNDLKAVCGPITSLTWRNWYLYEDWSTWHSDLKKTAVAIAPTIYNLIPSPEVAMQDRVT
ncbi:uncharacterized protein F5891DRAFT_978212 [Suillus fuscotomentosus]|uniref:Uncharacterized protein n=1 Tax=Suillus fuscotomentosus TaxID=1912939 RepID=A0AAD4EBM8_9AGAM|nr:uncharacterized protein F5891DRAFT_978212 [Suillus fuscotomentosus]KAG1903186.1 hypothetical protein F5891DRAFT_978212 [Suillus fuscotomentosus]